MTFLVFMLGGVVAAGAAGLAVWLRHAAEEEAAGPRSNFMLVADCPIVADIRALGANSELGRARATVRGLLRPELRFFWTKESKDDQPEDPLLQLYFDILFDNDLGFLAEGWSIRAAEGDLSVYGPVAKVHPDPRGAAHRAGLRAARRLNWSFEEQLQKRVAQDAPDKAAVALRALLTLFPTSESTRALAQLALQTTDDGLRLAAATVDYVKSRPFVLRLAQEWGGAHRSLAIELVVREGNDADLLDVGVHPVPEDVVDVYLERLTKLPGEDAEAILLCYLDTEHLETVADALIGWGTRRSLEPLRKRLLRETSEGEAMAIELALESIADRLQVGGDTKGLVAIAPDTGGDVSEVQADGTTVTTTSKTLG